jgi:hypothetical protein
MSGEVATGRAVEDLLLRELAPQVLGALVRHYLESRAARLAPG